MTDRELLEAVLKEADPIPNSADPPSGTWAADTVLLEIERRKAAGPTLRVQTRPGRALPTFRLQVAVAVAAAFVTVLVVVGLAALVLRTETESAPVGTTVVSTTTTPPATTLSPATTAVTSTTDASPSTSAPTPKLDPTEVAAARAVVDSAYALFNDGDVGWVELRDRGSAYESEAERQENLAEGEVEILNSAAAGMRIDLIDCTFQGVGRWSSVADEETVTGYYFICDTQLTDAFREPVGLFLPEEYHWVINDGDVVAVKSQNAVAAGLEYEAFMAQFFEWFRLTHPDLFAEITWRPSDYPDPDTTALLLEYLDAYLATLD